MCRYILRKINPSDKELVYTWRNQDYVRYAMYSSEIINAEQHSNWFHKALKEENGIYHILEYNNVPIGFIGITHVIRETKSASWTFYIGEQQKSPKGAGKILCSMMLDKFFYEMDFEKLDAEVIEFNDKSSILHEKLYFQKMPYHKNYTRDNLVYKVTHYSLSKEDWNTKKMKKILFTGGGGAAAEGIFRHWQSKYDIYFADADKNAISPLIPKERKIEIPFANEKNFVSAVAQICDDYKIDLFVSGVDEELPFSHDIVTQTKNTRLLSPSKEFIADMMNKYHFISLLNDSGLNAPTSYLGSHLETVPEDFFPAIMKPIYGRGSRGVSVINNKRQANAYLELSDQPAEKIIIQQYAKGIEYTVFMSADSHGNLCAIIPVKVGVKRGITIRAVTENNPVIIEYCKKFHEYFKPTGVYNIQLILDEYNNIFPFEVNPRVSTTFILAVSTGFDPIETFLNGSKEKIFIPQTQQSLTRYWVNHIEMVQTHKELA